MKKILPILLVSCLIGYFASCEKDDICVDGDTPLLVIGFFDAIDTTLSKDVPSLRIKEVILDTVINTIVDRSSSLDSIGIPLRINASSTTFAFITDSADDSDAETGNIDTLTINYETREAFISKACGIVANYNNLNITLPENEDNWIQDISISQQTIENSNNIHVKIFH
ncbi:hypothetical protein HME9304_02616 [Flagellimonas maritima]|uniref:Uncharacterized protein n=1 Tax=Flagellimonas maritima TaxID=1383885 RepID=A0A2Z4LV32_9FLAO|nr:DUF6452 family protein [Allomuricauda aurantiaca]AWX45589.1 hypothetical protein HME9304_02616 [Allomuricauda aurantiaca]